jgi:hypothetical protein
MITNQQKIQPTTDLKLMQKLYQTLLAGEFYNDHDESAEMLGGLRRFLEALNKKENERAKPKTDPEKIRELLLEIGEKSVLIGKLLPKISPSISQIVTDSFATQKTLMGEKTVNIIETDLKDVASTDLENLITFRRVWIEWAMLHLQTLKSLLSAAELEILYA